MILAQDPSTGHWNRCVADVGLIFRTHAEQECEGRLCDVHNRRGAGEQATWPLNWSGDRGIMEVICPCGIGHPTPAQAQFLYWLSSTDQISLQSASGQLRHGCCGVHCPSRSFE